MLAREEMTEVQQPGEEEGERVTTTVTKAQYGKIRWGAAAWSWRRACLMTPHSSGGSLATWGFGVRSGAGPAWPCLSGGAILCLSLRVLDPPWRPRHLFSRMMANNLPPPEPVSCLRPAG